jgi:hypothetical protein
MRQAQFFGIFSIKSYCAAQYLPLFRASHAICAELDCVLVGFLSLAFVAKDGKPRGEEQAPKGQTRR